MEENNTLSKLARTEKAHRDQAQLKRLEEAGLMTPKVETKKGILE